MWQNWACSRLNAKTTAGCAMMTKIIAILLVLCTLVSCQGSRGAATISGANKLVDLNENNWQSMLKGEWMVEFYAPWCPACKNLASTWEKYAETAASLNVKVAKIDVTTSPSLSGRFFVTALPTIYHVINGDFRQYRGSRDLDALIFYVKQKQWQKTDPISAWKKPNTIHMSMLSYFFKLSHALKDMNTHLQEEYGLPTWGSYVLFAFGTIFVGAALGLLLVCIVDGLYPPKKAARQSFTEVKQRDAKQGVEDLANDELEDENAQAEESDAVDEEEEEDDEEQNGNDEVDEDEENAVPAAEDKNEEKKQTVKDENIENALNLANAEAAQLKSSPGEVRKRKPRKD